MRTIGHCIDKNPNLPFLILVFKSLFYEARLEQMFHMDRRNSHDSL
jgi:hypothetical protein